MRGNCLCGAVEFEIVGELRRLYQCHCSLCRKQSGSTSNSSLLIESEKLPLARRRRLHLILLERVGFPFRLLLSLRVSGPQSPPANEVCLGPERIA
jgi:hypothetical protein